MGYQQFEATIPFFPLSDGAFGYFHYEAIRLSSAKYSVVAVPSARLSSNEKMRVLTSVDTSEIPIEGELRGVLGRLVPKEKRFKEIWFIFRPDRSTEYAIEVVINDGRSDSLMKWHGIIESCELPQSAATRDPRHHFTEPVRNAAQIR